MFGEEGYLGAKRQKKSHALIFPVHPRELKAQRERQEISSELEKIKQLRIELEELKNDLKGE